MRYYVLGTPVALCRGFGELQGEGSRGEGCGLTARKEGGQDRTLRKILGASFCLLPKGKSGAIHERGC